MAVIVVIPARFSSSRFPGKPLAPLKGEPVIQHVYRSCLRSRRADEVLVATDDDRILTAVNSFGGKAVMTSPTHISGTDRIAEAVRKLDYDIIVNVQGDEPLIRPEMIDEVVSVLEDPGASIGTLTKRITQRSEIFDPNTVKVVFDKKGIALYFSRWPIPYYRDHISAASDSDEHQVFRSCIGCGPETDLSFFKHIGIYSYRREALLSLTELPPSPLELAEKLEQLRALENNFTIKIRETLFETLGVDTPHDLERIEQCLNSFS